MPGSPAKYCNTNPRETQEREEINANAAELNEGANIDQINATLLGKKTSFKDF